MERTHCIGASAASEPQLMRDHRCSTEKPETSFRLVMYGISNLQDPTKKNEIPFWQDRTAMKCPVTSTRSDCGLCFRSEICWGRFRSFFFRFHPVRPTRPEDSTAQGIRAWLTQQNREPAGREPAVYSKSPSLSIALQNLSRQNENHAAALLKACTVGGP